MGCGSSKDVPDEKYERKKSVFEPNIPVINVNFGANVAFQPPPATKVIFIIGELHNKMFRSVYVCITDIYHMYRWTWFRQGSYCCKPSFNVWTEISLL